MDRILVSEDEYEKFLALLARPTQEPNPNLRRLLKDAGRLEGKDDR